jgi:hypothetical protein
VVRGTLVVLPHIAERLLEGVVFADLELDVERPAQCLPDLLIASNGLLPALEADRSNYLVDPVDDVLDDDRSFLALEGFE